MAQNNKRLGAILEEAGLIDEFQLIAALSHQRKWGGKLGESLVAQGALTETNLAKALAFQLQIPYIELADADIRADVLDLVPPALAKQFMAVPFAVEGTPGSGMLTVALVDPRNSDALQTIAHKTGYETHPAAAPQSAIERIVHNFDGWIASAPKGRHPVLPFPPTWKDLSGQDAPPPKIPTPAKPKDRDTVAIGQITPLRVDANGQPPAAASPASPAPVPVVAGAPQPPAAEPPELEDVGIIEDVEDTAEAQIAPEPVVPPVIAVQKASPVMVTPVGEEEFEAPDLEAESAAPQQGEGEGFEATSGALGSEESGIVAEEQAEEVAFPEEDITTAPHPAIPPMRVPADATRPPISPPPSVKLPEPMAAPKTPSPPPPPPAEALNAANAFTLDEAEEEAIPVSDVDSGEVLEALEAEELPAEEEGEPGVPPPSEPPALMPPPVQAVPVVATVPPVPVAADATRPPVMVPAPVVPSQGVPEPVAAPSVPSPAPPSTKPGEQKRVSKLQGFLDKLQKPETK